jgi:hypothetical protein
VQNVRWQNAGSVDLREVMALTATSPEIFISSVSKKVKPDSTSIVKYKSHN